MRFALLLFAAAGLYGQATVEAGLGAARAATTAAPAKSLSKAIAGAFSGLDKAANTQTVVVHTSSAREPEVPAKTYETIAHAEVGMSYDELIRRFGPPSLELAAGENGRKLTYAAKEGATQIEVKEGKVASIKAPQPAQPQSGVLTLPGK